MSIEKQILTGLIISDRFLREVLPLYNPDLFEIPYGSIVANWCIKHHNSYEQAPKVLIQDIFEAWKKSNPNEEQAKFIEGFLATLSDEYEHAEKFNVEYLMDKTVTYFKARSYKMLAEDLDYYHAQNDIASMEKSFQDFHKIEKICNTGIDILEDEAAWREGWAETGTSLFTVPGKLGEMLNEEFRRDSLIGIMALAKGGKTWNLNFFAHCAVRARCNVAVFQAGDLTQGQYMVRNGIYLTQRSNKPKYCKELHIPVLDCENNQKNLCGNTDRKSKVGCYGTEGDILKLDDATGYVPCSNCSSKQGGTFKGAVWHTKRRPCRALTWQEAYKAAQEYKARHKAKRFKLSTHPSRSLNVAGIRQILDGWERLEGWVPDVIIIDYADIMAPERKGNKESRDDINETWLALSSLRQERHCCVITATQANGMAIKEKTVTREHYAGDRRKFDHVTAMYALSQTHEEKRKGVTRWGAIVVREDGWDAEYHVSVLGCLEIGRPYLSSF
jgi:hypothetical protein